MNKYELRLTMKTGAGTWDVQSYDVIVADNLVSLLSQFIILIGSIHNRLMDNAKLDKFNQENDDIPF